MGHEDGPEPAHTVIGERLGVFSFKGRYQLEGLPDEGETHLTWRERVWMPAVKSEEEERDRKERDEEGDHDNEREVHFL